MVQLRKNDPVYVERENQQLEGVVAYVGAVKFASGHDWVGIRLTGSSAGMGKNDGTVKGERYFATDRNCGVFVRRSHVSRRTLTRLEELRLKRELAKQTSSASGKSSSTPTPRRSTQTASASSAAAAASTPAATTATPSSGSPIRRTASSSSIASSGSASKKSRLEELRERRAALAEKQAALDTSRPMSPATASDQDDPKVAALEDRIRNLEDKLTEAVEQNHEKAEKLKAKEEENASLQQSLSKAEQDIHELKQTVDQVKQDMAKAPTVQVSSSKVQDQLSKAFEDVRSLENDKGELEDSLAKLQDQNARLQQDLTREREGRANDAETLRTATNDAATLQRELDALKDQAASRGASDVSHYKEKAKLQAEMAAMKREIEKLEGEKIDMEAMMEELTLDKEQLQEEKEILADKVEELKIDAETAQMEAEELRMELEDAQASAEGGFAAEATSTNDADAAQALATQNSRLREALIRLREQTSLDKMETARMLRAAEKDAAEGKALVEELEKCKSARTTLEEEVRDLKEMVEQGSAFETMVEDLSDRVMALEDDNIALQSTIREMEEAADVTAELEEVQAEENKALMRDLEGRDSIIRNLEEAIRMCVIFVWQAAS